MSNRCKPGRANMSRPGNSIPTTRSTWRPCRTASMALQK